MTDHSRSGSKFHQTGAGEPMGQKYQHCWYTDRFVRLFWVTRASRQIHARHNSNVVVRGAVLPPHEKHSRKRVAALHIEVKLLQQHGSNYDSETLHIVVVHTNCCTCSPDRDERFSAAHEGRTIWPMATTKKQLRLQAPIIPAQ